MLDQIPQFFFSVRYNSEKYPGNANGIIEGANCQQFCFELLRYFGFEIGVMRSSDLWVDNEWTRQVSEPEVFDLLLFNDSEESYGAHVGIYIGDDQVLHLSKEIGVPIVWNINEFFVRSSYKALVGIKRPTYRKLR